MIKLTIIKNDEYANYLLKDKNGNNYDLNINFIGMEKPMVGTIIYIDENVLTENVSLNYGAVDNKNKSSQDDLIVIIDGNNQKYLQRYYG